MASNESDELLQKLSNRFCPDSCSIKTLEPGYMEKSATCRKCTIFQVMSGNYEYTSRIFYWLIGKGYFPYLSKMNQFGKKLIVDDIKQEVALAIYNKYEKKELQKIKYHKSYIRNIIYNQACNYNRYLSRIGPIESVYPEE